MQNKENWANEGIDFLYSFHYKSESFCRSNLISNGQKMKMTHSVYLIRTQKSFDPVSSRGSELYHFHP